MRRAAGLHGAGRDRFLGRLLVAVGVAIERWRYKSLADRPPGPNWVATGERFVDPETGKLVAVYHHPGTGERRYVAS